MHILTKVFVLFAAVLSILLSALTISYTINTDMIVSSFADARAAQENAEESLRAQAAQASLVNQEKESEIQSLRAQLTAATQEMRTLEAESARLQTDVRGARADAAAANRRVQGALEATKAQALIIDAYKNEVTKLRNDELATREQMLQMEERLSNIESQKQVLEVTVRALREEIASIKDPRSIGQGIAADAPPTEISGPIITGIVQAVTLDADTGDSIVQINLGQNDRVQRNTLVNIVRGSEFVCQVVITRTDLNVSTGRVINLRPGAIVRAGDTVKSRLGQ
ncbi:MAG: hypothetical protein KF757_13230 [Phycisphaeraceae bacterium]|nr:hypothetical protein [Phycisphaeraceae bacterium]MCW5763925.1 hypothetical protein [Phycisphaeraceae bacterium]